MDIDALSNTYLKYKLIYTDDTLSLKGNSSVSSYDENTLIIKCGKKNIFITGSDFVITSMNADELSVNGHIASIFFE